VGLIPYPGGDQQTGGKSAGKPKDIDGREDLIPSEAAQSKPEIVFKHILNAQEECHLGILLIIKILFKQVEKDLFGYGTRAARNLHTFPKTYFYVNNN
jgi:hypothetical protein